MRSREQARVGGVHPLQVTAHDGQRAVEIGPCIGCLRGMSDAEPNHHAAWIGLRKLSDRAVRRVRRPDPDVQDSGAECQVRLAIQLKLIDLLVHTMYTWSIPDGSLPVAHSMLT